MRNFIKKDLLLEKQNERKDWIKNTLSKHYINELDYTIDDFVEFNTKDAVVWIDPLDGTKDFVSGNLPSVTVLIGLAIKNRSRLGIVHNPFSHQDLG